MQETALKAIDASTVQENNDFLEYQNTQYNLLLLNQKRNELEQLRTLLQLALESGDMESLSQLSAIVQSLPDVSEESVEVSDNTLNSLLRKQIEQKEELYSLEQEQVALNKTVKIHQESLGQKRDQLQQLQQKLSEIKAEQPVMEVEEQVVTLVNPEGLDRNVSNLTLIEEEDSENLEDGMEENEEYLEEQERNLNELHQRIESLQALKSMLEDRQRLMMDSEDLAEQNVNEKTEAQDSDETLEALLRKLATASIEELKSADLNEFSNDQVLKKENEQDLVMIEADKPDLNIKESIMQAKNHVRDLEAAIQAAEDPEEKKVYMELYTKLSGQLQELMEVEGKLNYYRSIISLSNDSTVDDSTGAVIAKADDEPSIVITTGAEKSLSEPMLVQRPDQSQVSDYTHQYAEREIPLAWNEVSNGTRPTLGDSLKRSSSAILARGIVLNGSRRPGSSMTTDIASNCGISLKSKRLYESMKEDINRQASILFSSFENEPYLLLSLLKKLTAINSSYMKQKLLLTLDNMIEDDQQENDEESNNFQEAMNTDNEIVLKEKIAAFVMRLIQSPANKILNAIQLSNLNHFILNLVNEDLFSTIDQNSDDLTRAEDQVTILIDSLKPNLDNKTEIFQGKRLSLVQPELLSVIFQQVHEVYQDWAQYV